MCGILGWLGNEPQNGSDWLPNVAETLYHRGPDDDGTAEGHFYGLGFRRLSILDLSESGHQPMYDSSGRYVIVFNGEIFNFQELKEKELLEANLQGASDTEVLLNLLIRKGTDAIPLLNGMFAFCFLDTFEKQFIIARDRFGIKPFYYTLQNGTFYFASELKALTNFPGLHFSINERAVYDFLGTGYIGGEQSIYREVYKLLPATFCKGRYDDSINTVNSYLYWSLNYKNSFKGTYEEALDWFESLFEDAVKIRLRSDVPVGLFLSGGIDSGLVAAFAKKFQQVNCYNVNYQEEAHNEWKLAKQTAGHLNFPLKSLQLDANSILEDIDQLTYYYDEPFGDSSALPSFNVCKAGSEHATVYLTGDAGDEAFAGYSRYIRRIKQRKWEALSKILKPLNGLSQAMPTALQNQWYKLTAPANLRDAYYDEVPGNPLQKGLFNKTHRSPLQKHFLNRVEQFSKTNSVTYNQQLFDYQYYLPDDILVKMDRASMGNSIEVRSPFLDYRIHELAASLPREWLVNKQQGKLFLREIAKRHLPEEVVDARKRGFSIPINDWMRRKDIMEALKEGVKKSKIFKDVIDKEGITEVIDAHNKGEIDSGAILWRILILIKWESNQAYGN